MELSSPFTRMPFIIVGPQSNAIVTLHLNCVYDPTVRKGDLGSDDPNLAKD